MNCLKFGMFGIVLLFLSSFTWAADNSKWCGLMVSLYGVCSPELISNYLTMTQNPPKPPNTIKASVLPHTSTAILVKEAERGTLPTSKLELGEADPPLPVFKYSYYWNGIGWVKSRLFS